MFKFVYILDNEICSDVKQNLRSMVVNIMKERKEKRNTCRKNMILILLCHYKVETSCFYLLPLELIVMIFKFISMDLATKELRLKLES